MSTVESKEVFISYNQKNVDLAQYLCNMLEGAGISCWIAPRDIPAGQPWATSIVQGLSDCSVLALLVSTNSLTSQEVAKEVDLANTFKKEILPIRVEDIPLTGPLRYHLSTRQWVDAMHGEKLERFQDAMAAILRILDKSQVSVTRDASVLGQARSLVAKLNQRHARQLDFTNAMFSAQGSDTDKVSIFYPQRIGATGINLISEYDCNRKSMQIYGLRLSDGDPLKGPCGDLIESKYKDSLLPKFDWAKHGRNIKFATLCPSTDLTTALLNESAEECFPRFARHVEVLSNTVVADLIDWTVYAKEIADALDNLHTRLRVVFPVEAGWIVGAPEGERLSTFRAGGRINVFRKFGDANDDQGLLSITLQADKDFLQSLKLGILKQETWFDLGEWDQALFDQAKTIVSNAETKTADGWPFVTSLDIKWRDAGLHCAKPLWRGQLDQFVDYVVGEFFKLKELEATLESATQAVPALQDKNPSDISESGKRDWRSSAHYVRNRLRLLAEAVSTRNSSPRVTVDFRFQLSEWSLSDLLLKVKVGKFDAAVAFSFNFHEAVTQVRSLDPPDFETSVVVAFFAKFHPDLRLAGLARGQGIYHGLTLPAWMDKYEAFVWEQMDEYLEAMDELSVHLEQYSALSETIADQLRVNLPESDGWIVENSATNMMAGDGIAIYNKAWIHRTGQVNDTASLVVQILPNRPCFDELWIAVSFMGQAMPALEREIGKIVGACDFAFREQVSPDGKPPSNGIWAQALKAPFQNTGGSRFEKTIPLDAELAVMCGCVQTIAQTIQQLKPIFLDVCRAYSENRFKTEYEAFVDKLVDAIGSIFPKDGGWIVSTDAIKNGKRYGKILVYRREWQKNGITRGDLSFAVEGDSGFFDNLYFGVVKSETTVDISPSDLARVRLACDQQFNSGGKGSDWWASWRYAQPQFRFPGGSTKQMRSDAELQQCIHYFVEVFQTLKGVAPVIDEILMSKVAPAISGISVN